MPTGDQIDRNFKLIKDLDVNYVLNDERFSFEVFHTIENENILEKKDEKQYKFLKWYSIGQPTLIESLRFLRDKRKSLFHFTNKGFYATIQILSDEQKELIIQEIKNVHKIDIKINQIDELKLNKFECGFTFRDDDGEVININGFVKSFNYIGEFQIDFQAANNSMEYKIFKEIVGDVFKLP
jgi:hypothetical protein